jgi:hypothetical protein
MSAALVSPDDARLVRAADRMVEVVGSADRDRSQVYAAELSAFDGTDLEQVVGYAAIERVVRSVVDGDWWPGRVVVVKAARSNAQSSVTRCTVDDDSSAAVSIAEPQATVATAAHELAHALAGVEHGHNALFRRAHLDVVQAMTNRSRVEGRGALHVTQLQRAYEAARLEVADRQWPAPPDVGGAIAL